jgi:hypothetical protein
MGLQTSTDPRIGWCDKYIGNKDEYRNCLENILSKLYMLLWGARIARQPASYALEYYLLGPDQGTNRRRPVYFDPRLIWEDSDFIAGTNVEIQLHTFQQPVFQKLMAAACNAPSSFANTIVNVPDADTWSQDNIRFSSSLFPLFGGAEIRTYDRELGIILEVDNSNNQIALTVAQKLELYDFYDWCGEDSSCQPDAVDQELLARDPASQGLGTPDHPFGMYAGQFTALEKVGLGKPYHIYSSWIHENKYKLPYDCGAPINVGSIVLEATSMTPNPSLTSRYSSEIGPITLSPLAGPAAEVLTIFPVLDSPLVDKSPFGDLEENGYVQSAFFSPRQRPF